MKKYLLALSMALVAVGLVHSAASAQADPAANSAAYWEAQYPGTDCYKHDPPENGGDHGYLAGSEPTAVVLNQFNPAWTGHTGWAVLIVKGGTGNAVYEGPQAGVPYFSPQMENSNIPDVSHWIVCKTIAPVYEEEPEPVPASGNIVVTHPTCDNPLWTGTFTVTGPSDSSWTLGYRIPTLPGNGTYLTEQHAPGETVTKTWTWNRHTDGVFFRTVVHLWWDGGSFTLANKPGNSGPALTVVDFEARHPLCEPDPDDTTTTSTTAPPQTTTTLVDQPTTTTAPAPTTTAPVAETTTTTTAPVAETTTTVAPAPSTTVKPPVVTTPRVSTTSLPSTGFDDLMLAIVALGFVLLGLSLVAARRRPARR